MEAGRELNALVEAHVIGIAWDETRCRVCGWPLANDPFTASGGCLPGSCSMRPVPERRADEPAPYSTDIAVAWQVAERLRFGVRPLENGEWEAYTTIHTGPWYQAAQASTAAHAIALLATRFKAMP